MKGCRPLDEQEVKIITKSFGGDYKNRDKALFVLGVKTGLRISELLSLKIKDVFLRGKFPDRIYVERKNMKGKKEGRAVYFHQDAQEALRPWLKELVGLSGEVSLFKSRLGNHAISRMQAWRVLNEAYESNELTGKTGTHSMRKTFANKVYRKLVEEATSGKQIDPFRTTSKILGHRSVNSTDKYLSFLVTDFDKYIASI